MQFHSLASLKPNISHTVLSKCGGEKNGSYATCSSKNEDVSCHKNLPSAESETSAFLSRYSS